MSNKPSNRKGVTRRQREEAILRSLNVLADAVDGITEELVQMDARLSKLEEDNAPKIITPH